MERAITLTAEMLVYAYVLCVLAMAVLERF